MRIFIGIPVNIDLKLKIEDWVQKIDLFLNLSPTPGEGKIVRWISGKNLHITLVPPWPSQAWQVESAKLKVIKWKPFEIKFDRIELGPDKKAPRLIWASGFAVPQILDLRLKLYQALEKQPDNRSFRMHITLARFRDYDQHQLFEISNKEINWQMKIDRFVLYESHLSPLGADYEVLEEFFLNK